MRALSKAMAGVVTLAMAGGIVATASGVANAAYNPSAPPYPADTNQVASLTIFDATTGAVVTTGSNATTLNNYYFVSSNDFGQPDAGGGRKAALFGFLAEAGKAPGAFSGSGLGAAQTFPVPAAVAPVNTVSTPTTKGGSTNSFGQLASSFPNTAGSASDFYQLYQLRVKTTFPTPQSATYAGLDLQIDTTAGTWRQVNPTTSTAPLPPATPTTAPTATSTASQSATVTVPSVAGATSYTVTSSPGAFTRTGAGPSFSFTGLTNGTPYTFTYQATNANGTSAASPASNAVTPQPDPLATTTTVSLSGGPYTTTTQITVSAQVSASSTVTSGSVAFTDNLDGALGTVAVSSTGLATLPPRTFSATGATQHVVTASYTDGTTYAASSGQSQPFTVGYSAGDPCSAPNGQCTETQYFQATVAAGSLVISTPYFAANPFDLGTLALNDSGTLLSASQPFGATTAPAAALQPKSTDPVSAYAANYSGVTIVDRRPGQLGWTANLNSSDFTSGPTSKIDGRNLGFTGVSPAYVSGNALQSISTFQNPAATGVAPGGTITAGQPVGVKGTTKFASAPVGASVGTVYVYGQMTLNAPTSTPAGLYAATVTFTIV